MMLCGNFLRWAGSARYPINDVIKIHEILEVVQQQPLLLHHILNSPLKSKYYREESEGDKLLCVWIS